MQQDPWAILAPIYDELITHPELGLVSFHEELSGILPNRALSIADFGGKTAATLEHIRRSRRGQITDYYLIEESASMAQMASSKDLRMSMILTGPYNTNWTGVTSMGVNFVVSSQGPIRILETTDGGARILSAYATLQETIEVFHPYAEVSGRMVIRKMHEAALHRNRLLLQLKKYRVYHSMRQVACEKKKSDGPDEAYVETFEVARNSEVEAETLKLRWYQYPLGNFEQALSKFVSPKNSTAHACVLL